jgi:23S rRNA (cytidine1920-2'-O)/16S rRNA (cytidine1409-2'-O)-methyltransferase
MDKLRLDLALVRSALVVTRSQAESYIKLGKVTVDNKVITKPGFLIPENKYKDIKLNVSEKYVSRAALKLASVSEIFHLDFKDKIVLDVGSSTGGFTQYALNKGAKKVLAVEKGTDQLHSSLRNDKRIILHEKTDIRDFKINEQIDLIVIDVSFVSLREIMPAVFNLSSKYTIIIPMVKPQFEALSSGFKHKGVIKNEKMRRDILKDFENWISNQFIIKNKADSSVSGAKGNQERFYVLKKA